MNSTLIRASILLLLFCVHGGFCQSVDPLPFVDPFHGSERGNTFVGSCVPFGLMKAGPDVQKPHSTTGYNQQSLIEGFSHMHTSGTGGGGRYGNFLLMPFVGGYNQKERYAGRRNEAASPGYYQVTLARKSGDVTCKVAATEFAAHYQFTYHSWSASKKVQANLLVDISHVISRVKTPDKINHRFTGGSLTFINDSTLVAEATFAGGWGGQNPYKAYFALITPGALKISHLINADSTLTDKSSGATMAKTSGCIATGTIGNDETLSIRTGISLVSKEQALSEALRLTSFNATLEAAESKWRNVLSTISVTDGSVARKRLFYSCLYHTFLMPVRLPQGYYPAGIISRGTLFWDHYCLWDTWRTVMPLHRIIVPGYYTEIINSLLSIAESKGYLPDAWVAGDYAQMQGGTSADMVLADAVVNRTKGVSATQCLKALMESLRPSSDPYRYGREKVIGSKNVPYCDASVKNGMSKSLEYAYGDFCIAQIAALTNDQKKADSLKNASMQIFRYFDRKTRAFRPRKKSGPFIDTFQLDYTRPDSWNGPHFYEASARTYSMFAPHAYQKLIELHGGKAEFKKSLDSIFDTRRYSIENEPAFLTPFLYLLAGDTAKANSTIAEVRDNHFQLGRNGLPGQDDSGALSAWYVWAALGKFPIAGTTQTFLFDPIFRQVKIAPYE